MMCDLGVPFVRRRRDSCPSHFHESGFFFEFEAIRTAQVHVFTLETRAWSQPESASGEENFGPPRWNFTAVSVFAVPFWKIFMFGGADSA